MNIRFHDLMRGMNMGMDHDCGFILVPEAMFIKYIPASFICMPVWPLAREGSGRWAHGTSCDIGIGIC